VRLAAAAAVLALVGGLGSLVGGLRTLIILTLVVCLRTLVVRLVVRRHPNVVEGGARHQHGAVLDAVLVRAGGLPAGLGCRGSDAS